jgi:hypothetical protein
VIQLAILCSIDSLLASAAVRFLGCAETDARNLAFAFAACGGMATVVGGVQLVAPFQRSTIICAAIAAALVVIFASRTKPALLLLVPLLLSVDNLAGGAFHGTAGIPLGLLAGVTSGILAWVAFVLPTRVMRFLSTAAAFFTGLVALVLVSW